MPRTIRFNAANNSFTQGSSFQNTELTLFMGAGNDQVFLNRSDDFGGRNTVFAGAGNDVVRSLKEDGSLIQLGAGNDTYIGEGFGSFATERSDTVRGGLGNDMIVVTTFKSIYTGDAGNDRFFSFGQQNTFLGGSGIDTISYQPRDDAPGRGGVTVDLLAGQALTGASRVETLRGIENVIGTASGDRLGGTQGGNVLEAGRGFDEMTGRGGGDRFVFRSVQDAPVDAEATDLIMDYTAAQGDRIDLRLIDAQSGVAGNQAFSFIGAAAFSGRQGQLRAERLQDGILLELDVNGDGRADMHIGLVNVAAINAGAFLL